MGNGLGLAWNDPIKLVRTSAADTWSIDLKFNATLEGYGGQQVLPATSRFEWRILASDLRDMVGPNFGLFLHTTSRLETGREHECWPYFFTKMVSIERTSVTSSNPIVRTRDWAYYLPASFHENPYKTYSAMFVLDMAATDMQKFQSQYQEILYESAVAEETILIGTADYRIENSIYGRDVLLTPTPGITW